MRRFDFDKKEHAKYEKQALKDVPDYMKSLWSKVDFFKTKNFFFKLFKKLNNNNLKILDVGCGPGLYCNELHDLGKEVTGVDYSRNILKVAKKNRKGRKIKYGVATVYNLPFKKKTASKREAKKLFKNQPYKLELIEKQLYSKGLKLLRIGKHFRLPSRRKNQLKLV